MDNGFLQQEIKRLEKEKAVYQAQSRMLDHFVSVARVSSDRHMMNSILQKTLDVAIELSAAEKGSLFLLDENGVVVDSILTRTQSSEAECDRLITTVMDQGLVGWVFDRCKISDRVCKPVCILDTQKDDRWVTLPGQSYEVRSALVVPIIRKERLFGLLTLIHSCPGQFGGECMELLEMTAVQIAVVLENAVLYTQLEESFHRIAQAKKEIEIYSETLDLEMEKGREIQRDFLPEKIPDVPGWEIDAFLFPAIEVSGDFYDIFELPCLSLGLIIGDVCDKGVGAALFMALFRSLIRVYTFGTEKSEKPSYKENEPCGMNLLRAIRHTNDYITRHHGKLGMFATIFAGVLDVPTGDLDYINAGHEPPAILTAEGKIKILRPTGPAVGLLPEINFPFKKVRLNPGDTLIAYTDGVTEATSPSDQIFGRKRLHSTLRKPFSSAGEIINHIRSKTLNHIGHSPQNDDITILCFRRKTK